MRECTPINLKRIEIGVVKMNSQGDNVEEKPEHTLYEIEYSEGISHGRLKE